MYSINLEIRVLNISIIISKIYYNISGLLNWKITLWNCQLIPTEQG